MIVLPTQVFIINSILPLEIAACSVNQSVYYVRDNVQNNGHYRENKPPGPTGLASPLRGVF